MLCDTLQKEIYKAVDVCKENNNSLIVLSNTEKSIAQDSLYSEEVKDKLFKEFAEKFVSEHPKETQCLAEKTSELVQALINFVNFFTENIYPIIETSINFCNSLTQQLLIENYPDKRLVQLALYGRTERIRKKNRRRILKEIEKKLY